MKFRLTFKTPDVTDQLDEDMRDNQWAQDVIKKFIAQSCSPAQPPVRHERRPENPRRRRKIAKLILKLSTMLVMMLTKGGA